MVIGRPPWVGKFFRVKRDNSDDKIIQKKRVFASRADGGDGYTDDYSCCHGDDLKRDQQELVIRS